MPTPVAAGVSPQTVQLSWLRASRPRPPPERPAPRPSSSSQSTTFKVHPADSSPPSHRFLSPHACKYPSSCPCLPLRSVAKPGQPPRGFARTCSLQNRSQASRPGANPHPPTNFSSQPSSIANPSRSRGLTSDEASRSFDHGYNPAQFVAFIGSFEQLFRKTFNKIHLLRSP